MKTAFDAATPPATVPPGATTACIYAGGDTPEPIGNPRTVACYQEVRYWLPGWVRSNPTPAKAGPDASAFLAWLRDNGAPGGSTTFLDLEGAVTSTYVNAYGAAVHAGGFKVLPYTERVNLASTPALDGHFLADPTEPTGELYPGTVATQYAYEGAYDLSIITDAVTLWEANPPAPGPAPTQLPAPSSPGAVPFRGGVHIAAGNGWFALPAGQSAAYVVGVDVDERNPGVAGTYVRVPTYVGAATDRQSLVFGPGPFGPAPDGTYGFTYWYEAPASTST